MLTFLYHYLFILTNYGGDSKVGHNVPPRVQCGLPYTVCKIGLRYSLDKQMTVIGAWHSLRSKICSHPSSHRLDPMILAWYWAVVRSFLTLEKFFLHNTKDTHLLCLPNPNSLYRPHNF